MEEHNKTENGSLYSRLRNWAGTRVLAYALAASIALADVPYALAHTGNKAADNANNAQKQEESIDDSVQDADSTYNPKTSEGMITSSTNTNTNHKQKKEKKDNKFYQSPWFWVGVGAAAVAAGITAYLLTKEKKPEPTPNTGNGDDEDGNTGGQPRIDRFHSAASYAPQRAQGTEHSYPSAHNPISMPKPFYDGFKYAKNNNLRITIEKDRVNIPIFTRRF